MNKLPELFLQARQKNRRQNRKLILFRLFDITIGLLAGIAFISAVYYLSIWRW